MRGSKAGKRYFRYYLSVGNAISQANRDDVGGEHQQRIAEAFPDCAAAVELGASHGARLLRFSGR